jgi:hydrogenase-4 component E
MWVSLAVLLCNLYLLVTSRLRAMIHGVAIQGILISILPLLLPNPAEKIHMMILVVMSILIKGVVIPRYLLQSIRDVRVARDVDPAVGYSLSTVFGLLASGFSFYILKHVPFSSITISPFHASTAIATACIGIFIIVARRNVVSQVIGYLVFENSGFILGISIAAFQPLFVEMGVLLDMLVGIFIMVMAVNHIHTHHDTISIRSLERLSQ